MSRHKDSDAARAQDIRPVMDFTPTIIGGFLDKQSIPDLQKDILKKAPTSVWKMAAKQTWGGQSFTTGLSPKEPIPHYHLGSAAMYILKHGSDKIAEMPNKIKEARSRQTARKAYNPLDLFSDRRK